jgi:hypothetical protein
VFSAANGFVGVYHLADDPASDAAGAIDDASSNGHDGTSTGGMSAAGNRAEGQIGQALRFVHENNQYITLPSDPDFDISQDITISAWAYIDSFPDEYMGIVAKGDKAYRLHQSSTSSRITLALNGVGGANAQNVVQRQTYHFVGRYNYGDSAVSIWLDGIKDEKTGYGEINSTSDPVTIGNNADVALERLFDGWIDEVRIENVARRDAWLKLCYENQKSGASVVSFGTPTGCAEPSFDAHPSDASVTAGAAVTFSVTATGTGTVTYQWQENSSGSYADIAGQTSDSYSFIAQSADDGVGYRCVVTDACKSVPSREALLSVCTPASITAQPADASVNVGATAEFSVGASGSSLSYQWQQNNQQWDNISGETGATFTTGATVVADNGNQYRCIVNNACGRDTSDTVTLSVGCPAISVTGAPASTALDEGQNTVLSVVANGAELTYQWQRSLDAQSWNDLPLEFTATLAITATLDKNGNSYRCVLIDVCGQSDTTQPAVLTVNNVLPPSSATLLTVNAPSPTTVSAQWPTPESNDSDADSVWLLFKTSPAAAYPAWDDTAAQRVGFATIDTVGLRQYAITDASPKTAYWFTLWIVDVAGNRTSADSATVMTSDFGEVTNPLSLSASVLDSTSAQLIVSGFSAVPTSGADGYADSIAVWYSGSGAPHDSIQQTAPDTSLSVS